MTLFSWRSALRPHHFCRRLDRHCRFDLLAGLGENLWIITHLLLQKVLGQHIQLRSRQFCWIQVKQVVFSIRSLNFSGLSPFNRKRAAVTFPSNAISVSLSCKESAASITACPKACAYQGSSLSQL